MLGQRLVDRARDQLLGHVLLHVVAEIALDQAPRNVALAVSLQLHGAGNAGVSAIERVLDAVRRQLDRDFLDHRAEIFDARLTHLYLSRHWGHDDTPSRVLIMSPYRCEGRESNPHGFPHRILSPARLPVPPPSQRHSGRTRVIAPGSGTVNERLPPGPIQRASEPQRRRQDRMASFPTPFLCRASAKSSGQRQGRCL